MYYMKETVQVKLDQEDRKKLKKKAEEKGHTLSSLIRHLVKKFLTDS